MDIGFEESMAFWAAASACGPVPQAKRTDHGRETVYSGGDRNATVVGFGIDEMGHG